MEDLLDEVRRGEGRGREMREALAGVIEALEVNQTRIQSQISALVEGLGVVRAAGSGGRAARKRPTVPSMSSPGQAAR